MNKRTGSASTYLLIIAVLVLGLIGEYYYFQGKLMRMTQATQEAVGSGKAGSSRGNGETGTPARTTTGMAMAAVTPPALSDQQQQQIAAGTDKSTTEKTFNITGGNFYFAPNQITVNKGDKVTLIMTNAGGRHNIMIDEFNVTSEPVSTADTITVSFVADKAGTFVYYCSVPGHRQKGMWGTLVVR
ncbi:cupredoxin domain-containing protein [Patescibacteria group bacterium]|nr:cupredoxin domain-containing protein [Patescibacteria group bacterium]MCL5091322.1 cupredoxin domain-containing protein [Patescibacteria group bacterium]